MVYDLAAEAVRPSSAGLFRGPAQVLRVFPGDFLLHLRLQQAEFSSGKVSIQVLLS